MTDLELGMLVVGLVALISSGIGVGAAALHVQRGSGSNNTRTTLIAACQAGVLTPFGLLLLSYVCDWADVTKAIYVAIGLVVSLGSGALLHAMRQNASARVNASKP